MSRRRCLRRWARPDRRGRLVPPSLSTFRRLLRQLDGQALAAAFGTWLKAQVMAGVADAGTLVIALDGKTVRGARTTDGKAPHLQALPAPEGLSPLRRPRVPDRKDRPRPP